MWLYSSSREKSNRWMSRSQFQMHLLISGGHVCAPPRDTNMAFPYCQLCKFQSNVSADNSTTEYRTDLRLGEVV